MDNFLIVREEIYDRLASIEIGQWFGLTVWIWVLFDFLNPWGKILVPVHRIGMWSLLPLVVPSWPRPDQCYKDFSQEKGIRNMTSWVAKRASNFAKEYDWGSKERQPLNEVFAKGDNSSRLVSRLTNVELFILLCAFKGRWSYPRPMVRVTETPDDVPLSYQDRTCRNTMEFGQANEVMITGDGIRPIASSTGRGWALAALSGSSSNSLLYSSLVTTHLSTTETGRGTIGQKVSRLGSRKQFVT